MSEPVEVVRRAGASLRDWLEVLSSSPKPVAQRLRAIRQISQIIREVDRTVQSAPKDVISGSDWRNQIAEYAHTLRELRDQLLKDEIALRIRRLELARARDRVCAVSSWASLARHIG
jgi:hypothetical protein